MTNLNRIPLLARVLVCAMVLLAPLSALQAQNLTRESKWLEPDGPVYVIHKANGVVYMGGDFDTISSNKAYGAVVNGISGFPDLRFPSTNGTIHVVEADGNGGWYIGGDFTNVDGFQRSQLAHLGSNGVLTAWNPNSNGPIYAIAVSGDRVYVGGFFNTIGGASRMRVAALNASTGLAEAWNPGANFAVRTIFVLDETVYLGGNFTQLNGLSRQRLGAVSAITGVPTDWSPSVAVGQINDIVVSNNRVYVAGSFTSISSQLRNNLAALSAINGNLISWNPNPNGEVRAIEMVNDTLYLAGDFTSIGFTSRRRAGSVRVSTGAATAFNPNANGTVHTIRVSGNTAYLAGEFSTLGGQLRSRAGSTDKNTGALTTWNPSANNTVLALASQNGRVYLGGEFTNMGAMERKGITAFDEQTGIPIEWNPSVGGPVYAIEERNGVVYVGGAFSTVFNQSRPNLVAIDAAGVPDFSWMIGGANGPVHALKFSGDTLYCGGQFTSAAAQPRNNLAAFSSASNTAPIAWNPGPNDVVHCLQLAGNRLFVGGAFQNIGGASRTCLAAYGLGTGILDPYSVSILGVLARVETMAVNNRTLYIGGSFSSVEPSIRRNAAALDLHTQALKTWNPNPDNLVRAISVGDRGVFIGGAFEQIGGQFRDRLVEVDTATAIIIQPWAPMAFNQVRAILADENVVYIGGQFVAVNSFPYNSFLHNHFAVYSRCLDNTSAFSVTAVLSYTVPSGDETYFTSGIYTDTLTNQCGLDSVMTITVNVLTRNQWTGAVSTAWSNPGNWSFGTTPEATDTVSITSQPALQPKVDTDPGTPAICGEMILTTGAILIVDPGKALTVTGTVNNSGTMRLRSDATGNGTLITLSTVEGSGTFIAEQYLTGAGGATPDGRGWYLSPSVGNATSNVFSAAGTDKLWMHSETLEVTGASGTGYTQISDNTANLLSMHGYVVRLGTTQTVEFTGGAFNSGPLIETDLTRTGTTASKRGFHLLGNPYPSFLDWEEVMDVPTMFETTIWYPTFSGTEQVFATFSAFSAFGVNGGTSIIHPHQGFWVRVREDGEQGTFTCAPEMCSHEAGLTLRSGESDHVRLYITDGVHTDEMVVFFNDLADNGIDGYDSEKQMAAPAVPQLFSIVGSTRLAINGIHGPVTQPSVPLGIRVQTSGEYVINATELDLPVGAWLEDLYTGAFQSLDNEPSYTFTSEGGTFNGRFVLHFSAQVVGVDGDAMHRVSMDIFAYGRNISIILSEEARGTATVLDMSGRVITTAALQGQRTAIPMDVSTGIYIVRVETEKGVETHRVMLR